jgi:rhodanese-related sulfurtransferase
MTVTHTEHLPDASIIPVGRGYVRLLPVEAAAAQQYGALLVDIRPTALRRLSGEVPGALTVAGPVRDWRVEPHEPLRVVEVEPSLQVVVLGDGSSSSILAASALCGYGLNATDVIGGFPAWAAMRLPVSVGTTLVGHYVADDSDADIVFDDDNLPCGVPA